MNLKDLKNAIGSSLGKSRRSTKCEPKRDFNDELGILPESESKSCPRCGASVEPNWGDYYLCPNCGFGFTGTGRWTNGHMPKLLLEPLRVYGLIAMAVMALAAVLFVTG
jgi:hypothetical protein